MPEGNIVNLPSSSSSLDQDMINQQLMDEVNDLMNKVQLQKKAFYNILGQRDEINKIISQRKEVFEKSKVSFENFNANRKRAIEYKELLIRGLEIEHQLESILNQLPTFVETETETETEEEE